VALAMVQTLRDDLRVVGIDPAELIAEFVVGFQASLAAIGWPEPEARRLLTRLSARSLA
jgi:hypothetical protein